MKTMKLGSSYESPKIAVMTFMQEDILTQSNELDLREIGSFDVTQDAPVFE